MRAMVPFTWEEEYLLKGGLKPTTKVYGELMAIDIPEFSAAEAPPVVSWIETNGMAGGVRNPIDIRMIDGHFYMQVANRMFPAGDFEKDFLNGPPNESYQRLFIDILRSKGILQKHLDAFRWAIAPVRGKGDVPPAPETIEHVLSNDRERREVLFRAVAEDIVIIDGAVWSRVSEPVVVIQDEVKPPNAVWNGMVETVACAISTSRPSYGARFVSGNIGISIDLPGTSTVYSISDWEEAIAAHARIVHPVRQRYELVRYFENVEIHDPSVLRFDPVCNPVSRTVAYALEAFGKDMATWSRGETNLYLDIREALTDFETSGDVPSLERAVELLTAFMDRSVSLHSGANARVRQLLARWTLDDAGIAFDVGERRVAVRQP